MSQRKHAPLKLNPFANHPFSFYSFNQG